MITKEEISQPIQIRKFRQFVEDLLERYSNTEEGKHQLRRKKGLAKLLVDELYPFSVITEKAAFDKSYFVKFYPSRTTHFDADLIDSKSELVERFEITMALDGHVDSIRMEHLNKYGTSPGHGEIEYSGTKRNRNIEKTFGIANSVTDIENDLFSKIEIAYSKKCSKKDYIDTSLLIGINSLCYLNEQFWSSLNSIFQEKKSCFLIIYVADVHSNECRKYKA